MAVTTEEDAEKQDGGNRTMGRKFTVPYALYRVHGFVNPLLAEQTGFGEEDLQLLWKALEQMFDTDRSATRGEMAPQKLILFKHESELGNAPAHKLFERVKVSRSNEGDAPPRSFADYRIDIESGNLPTGISIEEPF